MTTRTLALLAPLLLGACVVVAQQPEVPEGNWLLPGTTWKVTEIDGEPYTANAVATLTENGRIAGQGPCNGFDATYSGHWPNVAFQPKARTRMACPELDAENAFFEAIEKVDHGEMLEDSMLLSGPGTSLTLVKVPAQ